MTQQYSIPKIVKKILPGVVSINVGVNDFSHASNPLSREKSDISGGSGFIVDKSGIILTNRHVVANPNAEYTAVLDNEEKYKIKILDKDIINDVAVLKIQADKDLPFIEMGDSSKIELGETVIAIGNTMGMFKNTISVGVVSGLSRYITAFDSFNNYEQKLTGLIQTDAAINPGNSGGPLIDIKGKVIGINAAMIMGMENIGFALPINTAKKDLDEIKKYKRIRQRFLGLRYLLLNNALQKKYGFPVDYGALVISEDAFETRAVAKGSPAEKAGIKEADIVLAVQDKKISDKHSLEHMLQKFSIGSIVDLKILRNNKEIICRTLVGERI
jgi:S1-C subfamily serine protease